MSLERLLQITVATLAALATLLLNMGQRSIALPMAVALAAFLSVWLTDVTGWFRLKRLPASLAAIVALLFCLKNLVPLDPVTAILELARLLVYLQVILLFQKKEPRIYWQLLLLSLLQVVVATVFNQGFGFGLLMVVYLFTALLALMLLSLFREDKHHFHDAALPGREIFARVGVLGLGTLLLTAAAFFALPRMGQPAWRGRNVEPRRSVGYSNEMALGELGLIIENPREVMRVKFVDPDDGRQILVFGNIYLQGAVLTSYERGHWKSISLPAVKGTGENTADTPEINDGTRKKSRRYGRHRRRPRRGDRETDLTPVEDGPKTGVVRQTITIEPMDRRELFCVRPFFVTQVNPSLQISRRGNRLLRSNENIGRRFTFHLNTTAIVNGRQTSLVPVREAPQIQYLLRMPRADSSSGLPNLTSLADRWMAQTKMPKENWGARARFLKRCLDNDERFEYSLEGQNRDREIDPIEDFIINNPKGHCEYFATALALMLRSQGIPARVVVGYKCDEFNRVGNFFQVRQLHAHAWVEVYLPREKLSYGMRDDSSIAGAWLRLDPTPSASAGSASLNPLLATLARSLNWLEFAWDNYVMEMDRSRQQEAIYQPLLNWAKSTFAKLKNPDWWRELGNKTLFVLNPRNWNMSQWFSWRGGLVGSAICLVLVLAYRGCRLLVRAVRRRLDAGRRRNRAARIEVAFYRRLGSILAKRGLVKADSQTPREFARLAADRLAATPETHDLATLPEVVVEAFYLVRFGRSPLDKSKQEAVEHALTRLDQNV